MMNQPSHVTFNNPRSVLLLFPASEVMDRLARALAERLKELGLHSYQLNDEAVCYGLCSDLGRSQQDRREYIRRVGHLTKHLIEAGVIVLSTIELSARSERQSLCDALNLSDILEIEHVEGEELPHRLTQSHTAPTGLDAPTAKLILSDHDNMTQMVEYCLTELKAREILLESR